VGDAKGEPKISFPLHKRAFSLRTGKCLNDDIEAVHIFSVTADGNSICVKVSE
jgi:nitrite reductase (NADH) small subunit